jgi:hypothetical protein
MLLPLSRTESATLPWLTEQVLSSKVKRYGHRGDRSGPDQPGYADRAAAVALASRHGIA